MVTVAAAAAAAAVTAIAGVAQVAIKQTSRVIVVVVTVGEYSRGHTTSIMPHQLLMMVVTVSFYNCTTIGLLLL